MVVLSKEGLLNILEGNRRLTLRVVEAFLKRNYFIIHRPGSFVLSQRWLKKSSTLRLDICVELHWAFGSFQIPLP